MLLKLEGIEKRFGGVTALRAGNLEVKSGEVHLLMGENGAGKSTLMKIVAGMLTPDGGRMMWKGSPVSFRKPSDAAALGIAMVHQESLLAPHLTVAENIFLGREQTRSGGLLQRSEMDRKAADLIAHHGFPIQASWRVQKLSPAQKQLVEICRALQQGSSLLIFDEPTSSLSESETAEVFKIVAALRDSGVGVIYITHRLEELRSVGDRVTVLRDGETAYTGAMQELDTATLIRHMVGREVSAIYQRTPSPPGKELLRIEKFTRRGAFQDISLSLHAGEILGMAGLMGSGRTELCRAIFGLDAVDSGEIRVDGKVCSVRSPQTAVNLGIALIPEDRQRSGLARALPILQNVTIASLGSVSTAGFLDHGAEKRVTADYMQKLRIKASGPMQRAGRLSGGNQQKVVIAKWLARGARIFLFDEPTRGIDVGAKREVFELMDGLAKNGAAILMVSSELPELMQVPDRIVVMRQGQLSGELPAGSTQEQIMRLAAPLEELTR